ncbi:MAG: pyridoxamine 5'-phosphate oxidase [Bryobacterales bacterium]|nr:pyridoxamine 5'-phosphate oxidase [Bryobacterales bacterium]
MDFARIRQEYREEPLDESSVDANPLAQFRTWLQEAVEAGLREPNAMALATVDKHGAPHVRMVLLKGIETGTLVFYTNYLSQKGTDLSSNPKAEIVFYWNELERQVRVHGVAAKVSPEDSDTYFRSRPLAAQVGAAASEQSAPLADRRILVDRVAALEARYAGKEVPRPEHWGGFRLSPVWIEFWQGRANRLHDRIRYISQKNRSWQITRLYP